MKILLFALFSLSFYQANGDDGFSIPSTPDSEENTCTTAPVSHADSENCLALLLKESTELLKDVAVFLCEYQACRKGEDSCNYENFNKTLTTFIHAAACFGCQADKIFGKGRTFENVFAEISGGRVQVGALAEKLVESLGIAKPLADFLCILVGGILQSKCVQDALGNLAPNVVQDLAVLYCKEDVENDLAGNLAGILKDIGCAAVESLGQEELKDLLETLGDTLKPVVAIVLNLTKQLPAVDDLFCTVLDGLLEKGGLITGNKDSLLRSN